MQVSWSNTNLCLSDLLSKCRIACMVRWRRNFKFWAKFTLQVTALVTKRKETRMRFDMVYITLTDTIKRKRETEGKEKARKKWERNTEETLLLLPGGRGGKGAWACAQRVMIDEWRECSCRQRVPSAEWWVLSVVFQSANDGWKMTGEKWRGTSRGDVERKKKKFLVRIHRRRISVRGIQASKRKSKSPLLGLCGWGWGCGSLVVTDLSVSGHDVFKVVVCWRCFYCGRCCDLVVGSDTSISLDSDIY